MQDIEIIIDGVRKVLPEIQVEVVGFASAKGDDLWRFSIPGSERTIQIESRDGQCPFLVETDEQSSGEALRASTTEHGVSMITKYLRAASVGQAVILDGDKYWQPESGQ